jgi:hypothetical protein
LSAGLPSQNASTAPVPARARRRPTASGAAQQEHISVGTDARPPRSPPRAVPASGRRSTRCSQLTGSSTCTAAASTSPTTRAFQMAAVYATVKSQPAASDTGGAVPPSPATIEAPRSWLPSTAGTLSA